jgi:hypothetical protein
VQSKSAATDWLVENPEYREELERRILGYGREEEYVQEECELELPEVGE